MSAIRPPRQRAVPEHQLPLSGQAKDPLRSAFALFAKELVWRYVIRFRPAKRPICLYASRRSGSTLLMEVISANRGVLFSDQPFGLYTASPANINRLPLFPYGQIAFPDPEEEAILRAYLEGILNGSIRANLPWKFCSRGFHPWNDRICLKITDAKSMIDWIDSQFDVHTVVSTRHPIAQALSVADNQWLTTGKGFLRNARFVEHWLTEELESFCWHIYAEGTEFQKRITDWALENLPLLSLLPARSHWLYVGYEDLIAHTATVVDHLAERLQLADRRAMVAQVSRPSRSTKRPIQPRDRTKLLNGWREKVSGEEVKDCFRVLDRFGIELYTAASSMPNHRSVGRDGFC